MKSQRSETVSNISTTLGTLAVERSERTDVVVMPLYVSEDASVIYRTGTVEILTSSNRSMKTSTESFGFLFEWHYSKDRNQIAFTNRSIYMKLYLNLFLSYCFRV